jgi:hypothetical protein
MLFIVIKISHKMILFPLGSQLLGCCGMQNQSFHSKHHVGCEILAVRGSNITQALKQVLAALVVGAYGWPSL